jgi:N6-adenosine-specific RNA methylase IME4
MSTLLNVPPLILIRPEGGAGAILADPPWHFKTFSEKGQGKSPSQHYSTFSADEIAALPVSDVAAPDCWLFLWVPTANLLQGLSVISGWGFTFVGRAFVWLRQTKAGGFCTGLGKTTRKGAVEDCWLARRGRPRITAHDVCELIVSERREHSRKPDEQYARIELLVAGPYIELFARQQRRGWTVWGDEVNKFDLSYNPRDDLAGSINEAYSAIRKRKAAGGLGWIAGGDTSRIVTIRRGEHEEWLVIHVDARIEHRRNRNYKARTEWIDLDRVRDFWPHLVTEVETALVELGAL